MKFHIYPPYDSAPTQRTIVLFAGWGMDEKPFAQIAVKGYRLIALWDYRDGSFPQQLEAELQGSSEVVVAAWSFGVPAATRFILSHRHLPLTATIAVNGTMHPVDNRLGIPKEIFRGTLEGLSEKSLSKFYLRMAGSGEAYREFSASLPVRELDELREELRAIESAPAEAAKGVWDCAVVSGGDRIIPPANQREAWSTKACEIIETEGAHLPDFNAIFRSLLTEKGLVAEKFTRAESTYEANATVQREIAEKLCSLIPADALAGKKSAAVLEIGCGTGLTTRLLAQFPGIEEIEAWDLHIPANIADTLGPCRLRAEECDAETEIRKLPANSLDLIFSASTVQWFNSLPAFMRRCARALRPGAVAVLSTFGPKTMQEIRSHLPHPVHYPNTTAIENMIPEGCRLLHLSEEEHRLLFPSAVEALRHAKLTGVNALSSSHSPQTTRAVISGYPLLPDGRAPLSYQPIYIVIQKI